MKQILPIQSIGVLAESELSSSARLVAVMLIYHVNRKTGFCFPSVATLAADCGCQPATVKKALSELRECGFITWETKQIPKSSTRANHYNLSFAHWSNIDQCNDQSNDRSNDQLNDQSNDRSKNGYKQYKPKEQENNTPPIPPKGGEREKPSQRFTPPSPDDVQQYCDERRNGIIGSEFCDFYAARGWMIGKSRMKDWRAAIRTWERNRQETRETVQDKFRGAI